MAAKIKTVNGKKYLVGKPLQFPAYRGKEYSRAMVNLVSRMTNETRAAFERAMEDGLDSAAILDRIRFLNAELLKKYGQVFEQELPIITQKMIFGVNKSSRTALANSFLTKEDFAEDRKQARMAAITLSPDFLTNDKMKPLFAAQVQQNVALFKTIPATYFQDVEAAVINSIVDGRGFQDLKGFFQQHSNGTKNYAHLRALDQTRKAYTQINITRVKAAGATELEWIHSGGGSHPDPRHVALNGKIFPIDEPPVDFISRGKEVHSWCMRPNCRCTTAPVIRIG
jgi:SPP1 gp7 family putative phage head morphogenesis protein